MVLTGVVVSELRDGSVSRVRGEGGGRPARAVHRDRAEHSRWVQGRGYCRRRMAITVVVLKAVEESRGRAQRSQEYMCGRGGGRYMWS
jgi:hypothetical protein